MWSCFPLYLAWHQLHPVLCKGCGTLLIAGRVVLLVPMRAIDHGHVHWKETIVLATSVLGKGSSQEIPGRQDHVV